MIKVGYSDYQEKLCDLGLAEKTKVMIDDTFWFQGYRSLICPRCFTKLDKNRCPQCFETQTYPS